MPEKLSIQTFLGKAVTLCSIIAPQGAVRFAQYLCETTSKQLLDVIYVSSGALRIFQGGRARGLQNDFALRRAFPQHIPAKDMALTIAMADALNCDTPIDDRALATFRETLARGWGKLEDSVAGNLVYLGVYLNRPWLRAASY